MPTFPTPKPITLRLALVVGEARLVATDRVDTVVEVVPADDSAASARAAEQTIVDASGSQVTVQVPKQGRFGWLGRTGAVRVTVELPAGSTVNGTAAAATLRGEGRLGDVRFKTSSGDITLDQVVDVDVSTWSGRIRIADVGGDARVKSADGDVWIGHVTRDASVSTANGSVVVDHADRDVVAKTANGDVRLGRVAQGNAMLATASGDLEVGIPEGTAAWLDVSTHSGDVRSELGQTGSPAKGERTVKVHARTYCGDIAIRRAG